MSDSESFPAEYPDPPILLEEPPGWIEGQMESRVTELVNERIGEILDHRNPTYQLLLRDLRNDLRMKDINSRFSNFSHKLIMVVFLMILLWYFPRPSTLPSPFSPL